MEKMEFLLLANSRKSMPKGVDRPGRCVVGVNLATNEFVRLVSDDNGTALDWKYFENARPGFVYSIEVDHKAPTLGAQCENWVIPENFMPSIVRIEAESASVKKYLCNGRGGPFGDPFTYYYESTYADHHESVCIMTAYNIRIYNDSKGEGRRKIDFDFYYPGADKRKHRVENMSMTDPAFHKGTVVLFDAKEKRERYISDDRKDIFLGKAYLVISLPSTALDDGPKYYNKFVAAVIPN